MDFNLNEERQQLADMLARFIRQDYGFEARRRIVASERGFSDAVWKEFANLGLLGIGIPEDDGGMGGNAVDTAIVMEALGAGLVVEPYLTTVVLCGGLVRDLGSAAQKAAILAPMVGGELRMAFVDATAQVKSQGGAHALTGSRTLVLHGGSADRFIVTARSASGPSLFLVDAGAAGVKRREYGTRDGQRAADITLDNVAGEPLGKDGQGRDALSRNTDAAIAAICAEAVGCMDALTAQTLEYLKTRKQFGVPIGSFQVIKHRMADMFIHAAQARSMALLAAMRVSEGEAAERARAVAAAKALVGRAARYVGQQAVQLHGGMGVTDELAVSHYFRRLTAINATFGDAEHHLARFSDAILEEAAK
jgi:alkylation response protein AidB-like acyl-CoA dehydrogenase